MKIEFEGSLEEFKALFIHPLVPAQPEAVDEPPPVAVLHPDGARSLVEAVTKLDEPKRKPYRRRYEYENIKNELILTLNGYLRDGKDIWLRDMVDLFKHRGPTEGGINTWIHQWLEDEFVKDSYRHTRIKVPSRTGNRLTNAVVWEYTGYRKLRPEAPIEYPWPIKGATRVRTNAAILDRHHTYYMDKRLGIHDRETPEDSHQGEGPSRKHHG